jgi:elongation factor G
VGAPQVAYREKLGRAATITYTHKKQTGGSGQFAEVKIEFEPGEPGSGFKFENKIIGGNVPKEYVPGVEKGLNMAKENGLLAGFPVIDVTARLVDGKYHDVDSNVLTFQIAAQAAFRELKEKGDARLLEPVMKVEVTSPEEYVGSVIGDLNSRRGMIQGQDMRGNATIINAQVPLANMFGYVNTLRSFSQGRASYVMEFSHYEEVPKAVAPKCWRSSAPKREACTQNTKGRSQERPFCFERRAKRRFLEVSNCAKSQRRGGEGASACPGGASCACLSLCLL